jgi:hypothetical protein
LPVTRTPQIVSLEAAEQDGRGKANFGNTGAIAIGGQKPSSVPARKMATLEVGKQDGKSNAGQEPPPAPRIAALEKRDSRRPILLPVLGPTNPASEVNKQDPKNRPNSTDAGAIATGRKKPSLAPTPKIAAHEVEKQDSKGKANSVNTGAIAIGRQKRSPAPITRITTYEVEKQDSKGKANSANAGAMPTGRQKPWPVSTPRIPTIEVKRQEGKRKAESGSVGEIVPSSQQKPQKSRTSGIEVKKNGEGKAEAANGGEDGRAVRRRN